MGKQASRLTLSDLANPWNLLALGFGSGLSPIAPGTFGTLMAVPFYFLLMQFSPGVYLLILLITFLLGIVICGTTAGQLGVHDHPGIVWDEFVGLWIALWAVPVGWPWLLAGFLLFRVFDIAKPWPIGYLDKRVGGGLGIMIDDVVAGLLACACLHAINWWLI